MMTPTPQPDPRLKPQTPLEPAIPDIFLTEIPGPYHCPPDLPLTLYGILDDGLPYDS